MEGEILDIETENALKLAKEKARGDIAATSKIQNANAIKAVYAPKIKSIEDQIISKKTTRSYCTGISTFNYTITKFTTNFRKCLRRCINIWKI